MNISNIKVAITEKDIYSIINDVLRDYVDIEGLKINKVLIDKNIYIEGSFKHKVELPFSVYISIKSIQNNTLVLTIEKINVKNLKIFNGIIKLVLKSINSKVQDLGIYFEETFVNINFYKLCKVIPMVDFKLEALKIVPFGLEAELSDFIFESEEKKEEASKEKAEAANGEEEKEKLNTNKEESKINSSLYNYKAFRREFNTKISEKYKKFAPYIMIIPDILALFLRLYKDQRVTKETKANISIALGYLLFPLDFIPDSIPLLGKIDDLAVTFYILQKVLCDIPKEVILENWEGEENIIEICSEAMVLIQDKFGTNEIKKAIDVIRLSSKKVISFFTVK